MTKSDLPNANSIGSGNLTSEFSQYNYLYTLLPRTSVGDISFTSSSSNITYATATYNSGIYAGQGQTGMLSILNNVLANYIITASDFNSNTNQIAVLNGTSGNYEKTNLSTFNTHNTDSLKHSYVKIAGQELLATAASVVFSGIPNTYKALKLVVRVRSRKATGDSISIRFNGDTAVNYSAQYNAFDGVTVTGALETGSATRLLVVPGLDSDANAFAQGEYVIVAYGDTSVWKNISGMGAYTDTTKLPLFIGRGLWKNISAINSITLFCGGGDIEAGSIFELYGLT